MYSLDPDRAEGRTPIQVCVMDIPVKNSSRTSIQPTKIGLSSKTHICGFTKLFFLSTNLDV
jgi:hypothetical protein